MLIGTAVVARKYGGVQCWCAVIAERFGDLADAADIVVSCCCSCVWVFERPLSSHAAIH